MGLSDQAMALRWVRENIHNFQGEPDRITLVGHEAGAACVGIHLISPITSKYLNLHLSVCLCGLKYYRSFIIIKC